MQLIVQPNTPPVRWRNFIKTAPSGSIALDGYVFEPACHARTERGLFENFNHHDRCDRLATRATCAQVLMAIRGGLCEEFPDPIVYVNDCDEDVSLSVALLETPWAAESITNPRWNQLVAIEDMLDTTGGAFGFSLAAPLLRETLWVFEPYSRFRSSGELDQRNAAEFERVIRDIGDRVRQFVAGRGRSIEPNGHTEIVSRGSGDWALVREHGPHARLDTFAKGLKKFVAFRERPDGKLVITVGRNSHYRRFPVGQILARLNEVEGLTRNRDRWGGGDLIGGSPRIAGTSLPIEEITKIVEEVASANMPARA